MTNTPAPIEDLELIQSAADTMLEYIERLAGNTWIDVDKSHIPIRKALHFVDGPASSWGTRIPFELYKKTIENIYRKNEKFDRVPEISSDAENDMFKHEARKLVSQGWSENDAVNAISGASNLDMLKDGAIAAIIETIQSLIPELPMSDAVTAPTEAVKSFMMEGIQSIPPESDYLQILSPVWTYLRNKQNESVDQKVVNYVYSYAINRVGTDVAKLWEAWAMYPTLKEIQVSARQYGLSMRDGAVIRSNEVGKMVHNQVRNWNSYLRKSAVLFSNVTAESFMCCFIATIINMKDARALVASLKSILKAMQNLNMNGIRMSVGFDTSKLSKSAKNAIAGAAALSLRNNYDYQVTELRKLWDKVVEANPKFECVPLEMLFRGILGLLADLKRDIMAVLRKHLKWNDAHWNFEAKAQFDMMENAIFNKYLNYIGIVERILEMEAKCDLDEDVRDKRAIEIIRKIRFDGNAFDGHIKGTPLPEGLSPKSPLANLEPVTTPHNLVIEPGIQGLDLPNEDIEALFKKCRDGRFGEEIFQYLPGMFRRK